LMFGKILSEIRIFLYKRDFWLASSGVT
jgi:hypothetical protein